MRIGKMPNNETDIEDKVNKYIEEFGEQFTNNDSELYCMHCKRKVDCKKRKSVIRHLATARHRSNATRPEGTEEQKAPKQFASRSKDQKKFNLELCYALSAAGIPLWKLKNQAFNEFLSKYTKMIVPDESTLRKNYLPLTKEQLEKSGKRPGCRLKKPQISMASK